MTTIYYAHPMSWYNTPEEALDIERLSIQGNDYNVINPNSGFFEKRVKQAKAEMYPVMDVFAEFIRSGCDVVAFRRFRDGKIGAGVAREILEAYVWNKPVWEVVTTMSGVRIHFTPADITFDDICTVEETKRRIAAGEL